MLIITFLGLLALINPTILAVDYDVNKPLNDQLKLDVTQLDQQNDLTDANYFYDFAENPICKQYLNPSIPSGGAVCNANAATWPVLESTNMMVAQLNLPGCSILPPHFHRATNLVVVNEGQITTYMIQENGARLVTQNLSPGQMTIFPRASMHSMINDQCEPAQAYSFLDSKDAGTNNAMNSFKMFPQALMQVILPFLVNDPTVQNWNATWSQVPPVGSGSNAYTQECMTRCGFSGPNGTRSESASTVYGNGVYGSRVKR